MVESEGVLKKGWLMKRSQQLLQWRWRFVSLTRGRLLTYTTVKEDVLTNEVELEGVEVEEAEFYLAAPLKYGFMVTTRDRTLRFAADTLEVREAWIQAIAGAFQEAARTVEPSPVVPELPAEEPKAPAPKAPKGKGKGPKGKGPGKGPKGKGPPPKQGKGVPKKASALPLGRRLSVQMLAPERAATGNGEDAEEGDEDEGDTSDLRPLALDVEALQQTFGTSKASSVKQMPKPHHEAGLALLPRKEAQNVAIVLKSLRLDTEGLAASLDQLQPGDCPLPAEECERFIQVLPAPELLRPLQEYKEETSKLRDIERELLPLAKLTRLRERLRLLGLFKTLDQRMADAMQQMCTLQGACSEVRKSSVLRNLLEIIEVLFNYVNYGQSPDTAPEQPTGSTLPKRRKVDVQSLTHLVETKSDPERAPFPKFHMLHWCVQQLLKQRPEFTFAQLEEQLKDLSPASFVNLAHQHLALQRLKEDLEFVKTELYGHRQEYQKKEEVEQQETPQNTLVKFDLEENDTASEDEIGREMSEDSVPRTPTRSPKRSSLGQLVSHAIDTFSFAEDWWHGSAIVGINEKGGLDAVLAADGAPPPPGMMHRWRPSGRCKPYLCEVRGALLVLYRVKKIRTTASLKGTFYVVLPGAEIAMLESLYASDFARNLAREKSSSGFELRPVDGRAEYFLTKNSKEADRWMDFLQTRTQQWDGGFISHYVGWGFISSCWKRLFCIIDRPNKKLLGYSHVRDYAEGSKPEHSWELSNSCSCAFDAEKSSATAKGLLSAAPVGFEIILENQRLQFSCDSVQHLHCWLEELQHFGEAAVAGRSQERLDTEAFGGAELFDLFADPSPNGGPRPNLSFSVVEAAAPATPTASPSNGSQLRRRLMLSVGVTGDEPAEDQRVERANSDDEELHPALAATSSFCALADAAGGTEGASGATRAESGGCALSQLRQLEVEMEGVVEQWTRTFAATEADCRALLKYFGLSGKGQLHEATQDLLQALKTFQQQLRVAWADLEKHQEKSKTSRRLRPSPAVGTSLPEAPSASESEGTKSGDCGDLRENPVEESFISVCSEDDQ